MKIKENVNTLKKKYTLIDAILLSIGGMIGGGIFILNGLVVQKNKQWAPLSWFIGLFIALLISFSYITLSQEFNDRNGGTIFYMEKMINNIQIKKIYAVVTILGYIVLSTVYAQAFGEYSANYLNKPNLSRFLAISTIFMCLLINYFDEKKFIDIENYTVGTKVVIFLLIILIGLVLPGKNNTLGHQKSLSKYKSFSTNNIIILGLGAFLTYEGFEMISNVTKKLENKKRNIPLSYLISIIITGLLYMGISYVTYKHLGGNLNQKSRFYSLLLLGKHYHLSLIGPLVIIFLAFLSDITAINSTLFVNNRIFNRFIEYFEPSSKFRKTLEHQIKLPFFSESRKSMVWLTCVVSSILVFCPMVITTNLGSILFMIIFGVIGYLGYLLTVQKEKKKEPVLIFNSKIPYKVGKTITILSIISCVLGILFISNQSLKIITGKIVI